MTQDGEKLNDDQRGPAQKETPYEVADFARKHGLSMVEARGLIEKVGNDCTMLDEAAKKLKRH